MSRILTPVAARWALSVASMFAASAMISTARAADGDVSLTPIKAQDDGPKPLLTGLLDDAGTGKFMSDAGLSVGGYAQGSWTYNTTDPHSPTIPGRGFDFENQDLTLNGIGLYLQRAVDASKGQWDVGGRIDFLYGGDARFTHSNGLFDDNQHGDTQYDITQAFVQVAVPWERGLTLTIGKFITPIGYEYVDPTKNTLFSHSYLFNYGAPYSQTGITGRYSVSDQLAVTAGITRGWDQSLEDNNDAIDFLGLIEYTPDSQWTTALVISVGPQSSENYGYRTVLDALVTYKVDEKWSIGGEAMYGIQADVPGTEDEFSQWYGAAIYPSYALCSHVTLNGRAEWFADQDGIRGVGANNVFEATLGVTLLPLHDIAKVGDAFKIRPEIRFDYADDDIFNGSWSQTTIGIDAVLAF